MKKYFKQSWQLIRQNALFSGVYIAGTALAISMVMVYSILWYVRVADVAPESNRSRSLFLNYLWEEYGKDNYRSWGYSRHSAEKIIPWDLLGQELESAVLYEKKEMEEAGNVYSLLLPQGEMVTVYYASPSICKVFDYRFLHGNSFTEADVTARANKVFISRSYARKLFGKANAVGEVLTYQFKEYVVCGVIDDVSRITSHAYANLWFPISESGAYQRASIDSELLGNLGVILVARSRGDFPKIREAVHTNVKKLNMAYSDRVLSTEGQPEGHFTSLFRGRYGILSDVSDSIFQVALILLALLLVPAVNLSGIIASGMENRLEELGLRKAFGASKGELMGQIIGENLLLTLLGGALGLLFSYGIVYFSAGWLLQVVSCAQGEFPAGAVDFNVTPGMLFNGWIFLATLLICMILNLLSASLPAWLSLRKNIVDSLTVNKK